MTPTDIHTELDAIRDETTLASELIAIPATLLCLGALLMLIALVAS
jgi:hypothetical protein